MEEELDLKSIIKTLSVQKNLIIAITSAFAIFSIILVLNTPNEYKAIAKIIPAESSGNNSTGLGQLGELAGIAGIGGGISQSTPEDVIALEIMQSWFFIENFIKKNNLEVELFAVEGWDEERDELIVNKDVYDIEKSEWLSKPPTSWALYELFLDRLIVLPQRGTSIVNVSYEHFSPKRSKEYVDLILKDINEFMRLRRIDMSAKNIKYLESQINKTQMSEMKSVFYNLIQEQTKTKMLAEVNVDYVFLTIDKAMIPELKSKPFRSLIVIQATFIGGLISLILVLFLHIYRRRE